MRFEEKARALTWLADLSLAGLGELLLKPKRCIAPAAGAVIALPCLFPLGKLQNLAACSEARSSRLRIPHDGDVDAGGAGSPPPERLAGDDVGDR